LHDIGRIGILQPATPHEAIEHRSIVAEELSPSFGVFSISQTH
jgi:hypothetical protein